METFLIILAVILALVGVAGSIIPGVPGPPLSWAAVLVLSFTAAADYSSLFLFVTAGIAALITVLDYVVPSASTKRFGGSKAGIWGCNIGLVISIFGLPFDSVLLAQFSYRSLLFNRRLVVSFFPAVYCTDCRS